MTDQPGDVLDEAVRPPAPGRGCDRAGDVWSRAVGDAPVHQSPHGAAECRYHPLCRAMAAGRASGGKVSGHLPNTARSLPVAAREFLDGLERSRPSRGGAGRREGSDGDPADVG